MIIFDAHLDLAWNAIDWNRDLQLPSTEIRRAEREAGMTQKARCENTVSFPDLRRGRVAIFIATLSARLMRAGPHSAVQRYTSMEAAYAAAIGQLAYYRALAAKGILRFIKDSTASRWRMSTHGDEMRMETSRSVSFSAWKAPIRCCIPSKFRNGGMWACESSARLTMASARMPMGRIPWAGFSRRAGRS